MHKGWRRLAFISVQKLPLKARRYLYRASKFLLESSDGRSYDPDLNGEYRFLRYLAGLNSAPVFLDVGCNEGDWTAAAINSSLRCQVFGFDINDKVREVYSARFRGNERVELISAGLGSSIGIFEAAIAPIEESGGSFVGSHIGGPTNYEKTLVRLETGDHFISDRDLASVQLLKVDVEGFELEVLKGFSSSLRNRKIVAVQFEYNYAVAMRQKCTLVDFQNFFQALGFEIGQLRQSGVDFKFSEQWLDFESGPNYVAFPKEMVPVDQRIDF